MISDTSPSWIKLYNSIHLFLQILNIAIVINDIIAAVAELIGNFRSVRVSFSNSSRVFDSSSAFWACFYEALIALSSDASTKIRAKPSLPAFEGRDIERRRTYRQR